jgi:hypothetical protein
MNEALVLPVEPVAWTVRDRFDPAAAALADRHYSREVPGSPQVGGPGYLLVLVTPCERAVWITKRHSPDTDAPRVVADGLPPDTYRCALFRNEGAGLASGLIREAVALTERRWGPAPLWATYIDRDAVRSSNPGYCFKLAGWQLDRGYRHPRLVRLLLPRPHEAPERAPEPELWWLRGHHSSETREGSHNQGAGIVRVETAPSLHQFSGRDAVAILPGPEVAEKVAGKSTTKAESPCTGPAGLDLRVDERGPEGAHGVEGDGPRD